MVPGLDLLKVSGMASRALGVGLVGCSWFALRAHVPTLLALEEGSGLYGSVRVRVVAVCSRTRKSMARAETALGRTVTRCVNALLAAEGLRPLCACALLECACRSRAVVLLCRHARMQQLFADEAVHVVLLVLPIPLMADAIEAALRAGKHVISGELLCVGLPLRCYRTGRGARMQRQILFWERSVPFVWCR